MAATLNTLLDGILEGYEVIEEESEDKALLDALLIGAAHRVERHEIVAYGTAHALAVELARYKIAKLLEETLEEEMKANKKLSSSSGGESLSQPTRDSGIDDETRTIGDLA